MLSFLAVVDLSAIVKPLVCWHCRFIACTRQMMSAVSTLSSSPMLFKGHVKGNDGGFVPVFHSSIPALPKTIPFMFSSKHPASFSFMFGRYSQPLPHRSTKRRTKSNSTSRSRNRRNFPQKHHHYSITASK